MGAGNLGQPGHLVQRWWLRVPVTLANLACLVQVVVEAWVLVTLASPAHLVQVVEAVWVPVTLANLACLVQVAVWLAANLASGNGAGGGGDRCGNLGQPGMS